MPRRKREYSDIKAELTKPIFEKLYYDEKQSLEYIKRKFRINTIMINRIATDYNIRKRQTDNDNRQHSYIMICLPKEIFKHEYIDEHLSYAEIAARHGYNQNQIKKLNNRYYKIRRRK